MARSAGQWAAPFVALLAFGLGVGCAACGGDTHTANLVHSEHISKATFKGIWPVSVDGGTLTCDATKGGSITFTPDGSSETYASNGTAMGWAPQEGWKNFRNIWLDDPDGLGPKVNSRDFDAEGHRLCDMNGK
ncbi:hypothetical protein [Mycobacterium sp. 852002-51057_SCH5723018]|uniref:hypothetical protein n=1 Tax=Mycobacterium sp. 852002-51057_SCH5723018 TaxID=1834094 RepID=UPI0007FDF5C3|nr:hypothetical protein [Mycobacterium sp. 852002-51057_SCH5723018]OBG25295.1 hypothetical protein A5764_07905 [Mycobacterium sp. 852002-51057_SCH5723018]